MFWGDIVEWLCNSVTDPANLLLLSKWQVGKTYPVLQGMTQRSPINPVSQGNCSTRT